MSEGAQTALRAVAALSTRKTLLAFEKNPETGRYDRVYRSAACPLPNATPKQIDDWKRSLIASADREVKKFKPLADVDGSGFVTTEEGNTFRRIYEIGVEAAYLCRQDPCNLESLSRDTGIPAPHLVELLKLYDKVQQRAAGQHLQGFPGVSLGTGDGKHR
jgi:hypothetical protein